METAKNKNRKNQKGFTLVEIMIVMALLVMLGTFAGLKLKSAFDGGKISGAKIQLAGFKQALDAYYLAHNTYPHTSQGLDALIHKPSVGKVPENYPEGGYL